ncbi:hypothetical protein SAMN05428964_10531 [Thalassospira xiamenensis]|uniref:Uncharacterized protein n=2 Tax=Thalassospira xiamenensis TaxID=220697 RepID=A0A285TRN6_9PROT|nr:hypothetical protein SAMN05428964_10531 [Thalassospira xiamenensis]
MLGVGWLYKPWGRQMHGIVNVENLIDSPEGLSRLKRDILFVDKICLMSLPREVFPYRNTASSEIISEIDYLQDTGLFEWTEIRIYHAQAQLGDGSKVRPGLSQQNELPDDARAQIQSLLQAANSELDSISQGSISDLHKNPMSVVTTNLVNAFREISTALAFARSIDTRLAVAEQQVMGHEAVSLDMLPSLSALGVTSPGEQVLDVCINKVAMPGPNVPWEAILEIRSDKDVTERARKLRLWSRSLGQEGQDFKHAVERLEDLLGDYERYMAYHKQKLQYGALKTCAYWASDVIESAVKLKLTDFLKGFLEIGAAKKDLLIAEMQAPGREVSLISKLNSDSRYNS